MPLAKEQCFSIQNLFSGWYFFKSSLLEYRKFVSSTKWCISVCFVIWCSSFICIRRRVVALKPNLLVHHDIVKHCLSEHHIVKHCLSEKHDYQTLFVLRLLFFTAGNIISQSYYIEYIYCEFINVIIRVIISH